MKPFFVLFAAAFLLGCGGKDADAQAVTGGGDAQLGERIVANLRLQFPPLRDVEIRVDSLRESEVPGMTEGALILPDGRVQQFLVQTEGAKLYLLAAPPLDVSRSADEVTAAIEAETGDLHRNLMSEMEGLPMRGNEDAPVTIVEFSDFQCPYCARAAGTVKTLLAQRADDVNLVYVHYPLPNHPWARPAAVASECAAQQSDEAFWLLHDQYFEQQSDLDTENVVDRSRTWLADSGVDVGVWDTCVADTSSPAHTEAVAAVDRGVALAQEVGVSGTPHFVINGRALSGARPAADFERLIDESLQDGR